MSVSSVISVRIIHTAKSLAPRSGGGGGEEEEEEEEVEHGEGVGEGDDNLLSADDTCIQSPLMPPRHHSARESQGGLALQHPISIQSHSGYRRPSGPSSSRGHLCAAFLVPTYP